MSVETFSVIDHVQGPLRGSRQILTGHHHGIGTGDGAFIHFPTHGVLDVLPRHATLRQDGDAYQIRAADDAPVFVNGEQVAEQVLRHGDLIRLGQNGPLLRYRVVVGSLRQHIISPRMPVYKPMKEVLDDCVECAKENSNSAIITGMRILRNLPKDISTQTSPVTRVLSLGMLFILVSILGLLTVRLSNLESQLNVQTEAIAQRLGLVEKERQITAEELRRIRSDIVLASDQLSEFKSENGDVAGVIQRAFRSIVFVQASYGFSNESGEMMRAVVGLNGEPILDSKGRLMPTFRGKGPVLDKKYTGTAFVASSDGLLISNHHVAEPWLFDEESRSAISNGLVPVLIKMVGYLPNSSEPFDVSLVEASKVADLALLRCSGITVDVPMLELSVRAPELGQSVLVIGYPTGIRALLARTDPVLVDSLLRSSPNLDFWNVAKYLADTGSIAPLITRGIIGQITPSAIVYDAETTHGGSGGPVIGLDGRVVAINTAIMGEFGGSNLGVPAQAARDLLLSHLRSSDGQ